MSDEKRAGGRHDRALWFGGCCYVPRTVAECPECNGELTARSHQWDEQTGQPCASAIDIECLTELNNNHLSHSWRQSDWQPVRDAIAKWYGAKYLA